MVRNAFIDLRHSILKIIRLFLESLIGMESEMMKCVGLCLILQVESNFVELTGHS